MSEHSPEPWKVEEYRLDYCNEAEIHIVDAKGIPVFCATQSMYETNIVEAFPEDWRRVVACVNACRGIPTEEIEKFAEFQTAIGRVRSSGCKTNSSVLSLMQELTARQILGDRGYKIEDPHE